MKLKKILVMLLATVSMMSVTVGNATFAAGLDMQPEVQQNTDHADEETDKVDATELTEQEETTKSAEQKETAERGGKESTEADESKETKKSVEKEVQTQETKEEGIAVQAAANIYLNTRSGSDSADGQTSAKAVKTLAKAKQLAGNGGTVYITGSHIDITSNTTISDVILKCDTSISDYMIYVQNGATLILQNVTVDGANVTGKEAGIYLRGGNLTINGSTKICNNQGPAIWATNSMIVMNDGEICNNAVTDKTPFGCAGVYMDVDQGGSTFMMYGGKIHDNSSNGVFSGGAVHVGDGSTFSMSGGEIYGNSVTDEGGAIMNLQTVNITGGSIYNNEANNGGGITLIGDAKLNMTGGSITGNTAKVTGGGIHAYVQSTVNITGGEVSSNTARSGAGITIHGEAKLTLGGSGAIKDNTSTGSAAGIYMYGEDDTVTFTMTGGSITGNSAGGSGGAIYGYAYKKATNIEISGGTISGNTSNRNGSGICLEGDKTSVSYSAALKLSGSPNITDDVFLQDGNFPDAKVDVVGTFTPVTPISIRDTSWTDYRTIVSYAPGVTPDVKHFTPGDKQSAQVIVQDGQDLQSVNLRSVRFAEEGYTDDGSHKLYKTIQLLPKEKISRDDIPEQVERGYSVVGWKNKDTGAVWDFDNDLVTASIDLYPVLKLNPATYELVADKDHLHGEDGDKTTLRTSFTTHEAANISYEWQWYKDGTRVSEGTSNDTLEVREPGEYKVIVIADDGKLHSDPVEKTITITKSNHVYGTDWKYDATRHWKECEECQNRADAAAHAFGDWTVEKTTRATGTVKVRSCTVCGYEERVDVPTDPGEKKDISVNYTFVSGTAKKDLPTEVLALLPKDGNSYANGETVTAIQPEKTSVKMADGVWKFAGYDADEKEAVSGVTFSGTWKFTKNSSGNNDNKGDDNKKDDNNDNKGDDNKKDDSNNNDNKNNSNGNDNKANGNSGQNGNISNNSNGQNGSSSTTAKTVVTNAGTVRTGDISQTGVWAITLMISGVFAAVFRRFGWKKRFR